jgi:hypothetical protein
MPSADLLSNLDAMRASLRLLNQSHFAPQVKNLDQQLAHIEVEARKATSIDGNTYAVGLVELPLALPGITAGVLLAVNGFKDGDVLSGVQGLMDACAALAPVIFGAIGLSIGAMAGGVGAGPGFQIGVLIGMAVGSIFTMISDILGYFAPQAESIAVTISKLLKDQKADDVYSGIGRVHHSFLIYASTLNDACRHLSADIGSAGERFHPAVAAKVINDMNFIEGNTMTTYWDVIDWLSGTSNQTHPLWPLILDATCNAYTLLLLAIIRLQMIVASDGVLKRYRTALAAGDESAKSDLRNLWSSAAAKLQAYAVSNRINLEELRGLQSAAHGHGTLWRFTPGLEAGLLDPKFSTSGLGGNSPKLSIAVCSQDQALPNPAYHQYAIAGNSHLYYWRVLSGAADGKPVFRLDHDGNDTGQTVQDVFATPGTDLSKPNHALVYTISEHTKAEGRFFDANGKQIGNAFFSYHLPANDRRIAALTAVRAVHDPYSYADDPANGALQNIASIVYILGKQKPQPSVEVDDQFLVLLNGGEARQLPVPVGGIQGIAVDQDYLWLYAQQEARCATHASVAKFIQSGGYVDWLPGPNLPGVRIQEFYCCDDGTLLASLPGNGGTFSADYRVDLKQRKITNFAGQQPLQWTKVRNDSANSFEKLPLFCWPQYESLTDTLEALQKVFDRA